MMNPMEMNMAQRPRRSGILMPVVVGLGAFAVGAVMTFGYVQWTSQQNQLALMTQMVQQMQQPAPQQVVTRNAPVDLLTVAVQAPAPAAATPQPAPEIAPTQVALAAPAAGDKLAQTTADRIRALVSRSSDPLVSAAIAQDVARRETMSVAIQGVNQLVEAAVAGNYELTKAQDGNGLRISFKGHEEDQAELERLLASAAGAGMIAFSDAVYGSDGSFNGEVILFDLVERALVHGSPEERRTGAAIREQAGKIIGTNRTVTQAPTNDQGERFYVVESGDSLAYIALQFYGNTNDYLRIFKANQNILTSPEKIQIGQRLVIPSA